MRFDTVLPGYSRAIDVKEFFVSESWAGHRGVQRDLEEYEFGISWTGAQGHVAYLPEFRRRQKWCNIITINTFIRIQSFCPAAEQLKLILET